MMEINIAYPKWFWFLLPRPREEFYWMLIKMYRGDDRFRKAFYWTMSKYLFGWRLARTFKRNRPMKWQSDKRNAPIASS